METTANQATGATQSAPVVQNETCDSETPALKITATFLRANWLLVVGISVALLIPCFWHPRIAAGDLPSHTYNAWLVQLIEQGKAPGLWLARQWNNVLFDYSLSAVARVVGLRVAEKIVVAAAVLLFFWGAFALICALTRRTPWFVMPALAAFAYGWTFEQGFMNYYLSLGLAFVALALIARGRGRELLLLLLLVPLIWLAHLLGCVLVICAGTYIYLANRFGARAQNFLFAGAIAVLVAVHFFLAHSFNVMWNSWPFLRNLLRFNGTDQLITYGVQYRAVAYAMFALLVFYVAMEIIRRVQSHESIGSWWLSLQLYGIAVVAAFLLPRVLYLPEMLGPQVGLLTDRLTSVTAVLALCVVGAARPQRWHLAGFAAVATVFFFYLYVDTGTLNHMEEQVERYADSLPPDTRVVATIWPLPGSRVLIDHFVDRACIGHCYSYGNYEPSSGQFRVRARPENGIVAANFDDTDAIESGTYIVQPQDLPMFQIFQCQRDLIGLCMRQLDAGERNGRVGYHPALRH
jgi:hypothetical protein